HAVAGLISPRGRGGGSVLAAFVLLDAPGRGTGTASQSPLAPSSEAFFWRAQTAHAAISKALPDYMVPAIFLPLLYIPLTPTGKTNRLELKEVGDELSKEALDSYIGSSVSNRVHGNGIASKDCNSGGIVKELVGKVLNIPKAQLRESDNFFHVGGDSIKTMQLAMAVRATGVPLTMPDVFSNPLLSELRTVIEEKRNLHDSSMQFNGHQTFALFDIPNRDSVIREVIAPQLLLSSNQSIQDIVPMTKMQQFMGSFPRQYYKLRLRGNLDRTRLKAACEMLVEHHPIFRTVYVEYQGQMLQVVLNRIDPNFQFYETESSIQVPGLVQRLCEHDDKMPIPLVSPAI
ncbi:hypothetical protein LTS12_028867, partial [Elasticomyces elasticus]